MKFTAIALLSATLSQLAYAEIATQSDLMFVDTKSQVSAPTRLNQIRSDAPAPVTVITAEDIKNLGFRRIEDVLRIVPGMVIGERSASDIRVNFHGGPAFYGKRLQILIDGVSFFQPDFSIADWGKFPLSLNDIARIEVVRSSSAATFGTNAVVGTINIISKSASLTEVPATLKGFSSTDGQKGIYGRIVKHNESLGGSLSVERFLDSGFDRDEKNDSRHDGQELNRLFATGTLSTEDWLFSAKGGLTQGSTQVQFIQREQTSFPDVDNNDQFLNLKAGYTGWDNHTVSIQGSGIFLTREQSWGSCVPTIFFSSELAAVYRSSPELANALIRNQPLPPLTPEQISLVGALQTKLAQLGAAAFSPTCGTVNQKYTERSLSLELQDIYQYSENWRHVAAIGLKSDRGVSETFMNGSRYNQTRYGLFNLEYTDASMSSNIGAFVESDDINTTSISSRGSLNLKLHPQATLRLALAHSERTPDTWEQTVDWSYTVRDLQPLYDGQSARLFYQSANGPGDLRSEVMLERDVGLLFLIPDLSMTIDINYFQNTLTHLISEKIEFSNFNPTNDGSAKLNGVDIEIVGKVTGTVSVGAGYSYQDMDASNAYEETLAPQHSGFSYGTWHLPQSQALTMAIYASDDAGGSKYFRTDAIYSKSWKIAKSLLDTAIALRHYQTKHQRYFIDYGVYEDNIRDHSSEMELSFNFEL